MIVSHPDDETLWGGANLYKDQYFVVCLTNGFNLKRANDFRKLLEFTKNRGIILDYPDTEDLIRDDWSEVKTGILKDLSTILNYKKWDKVVTHGPDGTTGHIHHKKTSEYVTKIAKESNKPTAPPNRGIRTISTGVFFVNTNLISIATKIQTK